MKAYNTTARSRVVAERCDSELIGAKLHIVMLKKRFFPTSTYMTMVFEYKNSSIGIFDLNYDTTYLEKKEVWNLPIKGSILFTEAHKVDPDDFSKLRFKVYFTEAGSQGVKVSTFNHMG